MNNLDLQELVRLVKRGKVVELEKTLRNHNVGVATCCVGRVNYSLLHWACHYGALEVAQWLLQRGVHLSITSTQGWSPLHVSAIRGQHVCAQALVNYNCDLSQQDLKGHTSLHLAAAHGRVLTLQTLLRAGADVASVDNRGWSVVHHAAFHGYHGILQILKKWGANLEDVDDNGDTASHLSAQEGHLSCLKYLLCSHGNIVEAIYNKNNLGDSPKTLAIRFEKQNCIEYMTKAEEDRKLPEFYKSDEYPAHFAAYNGNLQLLSMLISEGHCHINQPDPLGCSPAHKAASNGHMNCLQWLIDHGANIAMVNNAGESPKDLAKRYGHDNCVDLLGGNSDTDLTDEEDEPEPLFEPGALARAERHLAEMTKTFKRAQRNYEQLGGAIDEVLSSSEKQSLERRIAELEMELEYERLRREEVESQADLLRKNLQQQTLNLELSQNMLQTAVKQKEELMSPPAKSTQRKTKSSR
ncbi:ankyrin repeat domain-containing protein 42-like [Dysidea avara]|uniref:ankyrin repeat domain-containing protein 42-like n=1 Tax=Dysidea avara TaxID=196820 RepID=UPI00332EFF82